jgi:dolichyl-phosphate-mannose-protein mannosyltransferase
VTAPPSRQLGDFVPGLLFAAAIALFVARIEIPSVYIYDEVYHAYTAGEYVRGNADAFLWNTHAPRSDVAYMWNHPPLGVLLIASGILFGGNDSFGWRMPSAIFGAAGIVLAYVLGLRLTRRRGIAILAACLLLADGLYFVQSRTGMLDMFLTFFLMGAMLAFYAYLTAPPHRSGRLVVVTGTFLGLAVATKWSAAYPAAIVGAIVLWRAVKPPRPTDEPMGPVALPAFSFTRWSEADHGAIRVVRNLGWVALGMLLIPAAMYLAAYIPFFATGHGWDQFVELQNQILYYHSHLHESHPYQSKWWQWPLALRPVWYFAAGVGDRVANIYANGNPVLTIAFVPASLAIVAAWWRRRDPAFLVLLTGFFGQWLPWALVPRISFAYHFLPATPFGCIAVAVALGSLHRRGAIGRALCVAYVGAIIASFAFFYPIYAAVPLTKQALELRMLLPSWR